MGNRIAKIEGLDWWVVYQSTVGALYEPIFHDELSAWLYARVADSRRGDVTYSLGRDVSHFVKLSYGAEDDFYNTAVYQNDLSAVTCAVGPDVLFNLYLAFLEWQKNTAIAPPVRKDELTFDEFEKFED